MKNALIRYRVKADKVAENEAYVAKVFEQLAEEQPAGLRYATFKLADGVSFAHIVSVEGAGSPLAELPAFQAFIAQIGERCDEPPVRTELETVGAYRFFD
jgi:quinol monooxygenase YgiN